MGKEGEVIDQVLAAPELWRDTGREVIQRVVFVSGGMGGIGTAICRRLAQIGHTVIAGCLPGYENRDEWLAAMRGAGYRVHAGEADVSDFDSCAGMFESLRSIAGPVDIL